MRRRELLGTLGLCATPGCGAFRNSASFPADATLSGWRMADAGPGRPRAVSPSPTGTMREAWRVTPGRPTALATTPGGVFVGTRNGATAYTTAGEQVWTVDTNQRVTGLAIVDERAYVSGGKFHVLNARSGEPIWTDRPYTPEIKGGVRPAGQPAVTAQRVYVSFELFLTAYTTAGEREQKWQNDALFADVFVRDGWRYCGRGAITPDGDIAWTADGPLTVAGDRAYVFESDAQRLHALDPTNGESHWTVGQTDAPSGIPSADAAAVYLGGGALAAGDGTRRWAVDDIGQWYPPALLPNDKLLEVARSGRLVQRTRDTSDILAEHDLGVEAIGRPAVASALAVVPTHEGCVAVEL